ncbi:hypothetical protein GCM10010282_30090 [Streptomyces roseolus]|nr:hypothetical protein GCM10010282_30090 [Streptomyces roseolus]
MDARPADRSFQLLDRGKEECHDYIEREFRQFRERRRHAVGEEVLVSGQVHRTGLQTGRFDRGAHPLEGLRGHERGEVRRSGGE